MSDIDLDGIRKRAEEAAKESTIRFSNMEDRELLDYIAAHVDIGILIITQAIKVSTRELFALKEYVNNHRSKECVDICLVVIKRFKEKISSM